MKSHLFHDKSSMDWLELQMDWLELRRMLRSWAFPSQGRGIPKSFFWFLKEKTIKNQSKMMTGGTPMT